jgi:hypothetical protein
LQNPKPSKPPTATIPATGNATVVVVVNPITPKIPAAGAVIVATVIEPVPAAVAVPAIVARAFTSSSDMVIPFLKIALLVV